ncbi:MAG TPA: hypothetical protein VMA72_05595 [Streptosporangiaceae bacterium]|nr:hypothetical protein [Streptosporangiaceae bacterium]
MDDRLATAVSHWAPRFTTNGVTAGDFDRIVSGISSWYQWCSAGEHLSQAAVYFHFAKFLFVSDMDQMRAAHQHCGPLPD